ncbi:restriction endonuclease subunit S [Gilliamella apicola]|uniref:restriction endonuclease subunit S n=1 Tax=Gilliamella apicola TaxID=1196095 RepID=UPI00080F586F|nr:restriction endonuclease subunit S [Gilliamella apis]OCF94842.1 hypothetical protein A9G16_02005 [Gilliamella apis]
MSKTKKLVPKRRFRVFINDNEWKKNFLHEISEVYDGTHQTPNYTKTGIMFLSVENIKTLHSEKFISKEAYKKDFKIKPERNDILMTRIGDIGTANIIKYDIPIAYYVSLALIKAKLNAYFLKANITSPYIQAELWKRTLHIAFPKKINKSEIENVLVKYPDKKEQIQIGEFFKKLDILIQTQQKKLEKTKILKSAYLAEMFPTDGELKPKIRFKEFRENWQLLTLGELKDVRDGTHDSPTYHKQGFPLVTSKNLTDSGLDINEVSLISKTDFEKINKRSKVDRGDILFGMIGTIGNPVLVERDDFAIKNVALIKKGGNILNIFLIQLLKSQIFEKYVNSKNVGNTQKFLALSQIREFNLVTPFIKEQTKIGNFFKLLDKKVALEQRKLEKLNNIKQAYLNEMFV